MNTQAARLAYLQVEVQQLAPGERYKAFCALLEQQPDTRVVVGYRVKNMPDVRDRLLSHDEAMIYASLFGAELQALYAE